MGEGRRFFGTVIKLCAVVALMTACAHSTNEVASSTYAPPAASALKLPDKLDRDSLFKVWDRVWCRYQTVGWTALTPAEQVFYVVWHLESEVNHGGFQYYYYYSGGDHALDAPAALDTIGAGNLKAILLKANAAFPDSKPPRDIDQRQAYLDDELGERQHLIWASLDEQVFKYPDPTEALLWQFYLSHKEHFR